MKNISIRDNIDYLSDNFHDQLICSIPIYFVENQHLVAKKKN